MIFEPDAPEPRRRRFRAIPVRLLLPNMITLLSLCAGLTAIRLALEGKIEWALGAIVFAAALDGIDGRVARMLKGQSKFGAELDSLADFLSFGVAPAILTYLWVLHDVRGIGWALAMLFATCCALRLARFNTEREAADRPRWMHHFFTGIPAPAAAGLALTPMIMSFVLGDDWTRNWLLNAVFVVFVAVMMVSRVPTFSIKRIRVKPEMVLPTLVLASAVIAGLVVESWLTLSIIALIYLFSIPFSVLSARRMQRRELSATTSAATPPATTAPPTADAEPPSERVVTLGPPRQQRPG